MDQTADSLGKSALDNLAFISPDGRACASASRFRGAGGVEEVHLVVRPLEYAPFDQQLDWLHQAYQHALKCLGLDDQSAVLRRFFCSDLLNQSALLDASPLAGLSANCAVSRVCQSPAGEAKVALWAYHIHDPAAPLKKTLKDGTLTLRRSSLSHHWTCGLMRPDAGSSGEQTREIFEQYDRFLASGNMALADHVLRTWLFVSHIDFNYAGLVAARREFFARRGLTDQTHYIASTGIEGTGPNPAAGVMMDACAVSGLRPGQIEYLCAPDFMCPTSRYGVTFERGTCVSYRDRRHLLISGTASIDNEGRIVHEGDIVRQFDRTFENVEALLHTRDASLDDLVVLLVYVRDPADVPTVQGLLGRRFAAIPTQVVTAPVCRPGWLIEAEGIAILPSDEPALPAF